MTSFYYICKIDTLLGEQSLDPYEKDLGFSPVWIDIDAAIKNNKAILQSKNKDVPRWTARETYVLEFIKKYTLTSVHIR